MSHLTSGLIGAAVATVVFGAAQFAMGNDIAGAKSSTALAASVSVAQPTTDVNRTSKSDRVAVKMVRVPASKTITVRLAELPNTSVLVRIPAVVTTIKASNAVKPDALKSDAGRSAPQRRQVACEPVVSVLTDVAKLLQPGRCIT